MNEPRRFALRLRTILRKARSCGVGLGAFLLLAALPGLAPAAQRIPVDEAPPVKVELLADASAVVPGRPFKVGVLFHVLPEFHIYWKNPGDAGLATSVTFDLPAGFAVGPLQWPLPTRFVQPGDIVGYGYERDLLLTAEVTPPDKLEIGQDLELRAKVSWLSCRNICIPGKAQLSAKLLVANQAEPANTALFSEWAARLPQPVRSQAEVAGPLQIALIPEIKIAVPWKAAPQNVEFFPAPPEDVLMDRLTVATSQTRTIITFAARRTGPYGPAESIECVVAYTLPDGARKGFPVRIPLPAPSAPPAAK